MTSRTEITINPDGSATTSSTSSTLVIHPEGGSTKTVVTSSGSVSQSFASSSTTQMSKSSSTSANTSTTKTVKQTMTSSKTVKSSSSTMKSSSIKTSSASSKSISVKSNSSSFKDTFGKDFGIDVDAEMKKLMASADMEVQSIREKFFRLQPLALMGTESNVIKLDNTSINDYVDKAHNDRLKFNFDVTEFESESINVKSDGNKIEVHAKKRAKKGDDETSEEYSRTYEMPTSGELDPAKVTSSVFKDGILTIELPVSDAIGSA